MVDAGGEASVSTAVSRRLSSSNARRRLGDDLRTIRERAGLTLAEAAAQIQRSAPTLSRLENGRAIPRLVDVKALLDHYAAVHPASVSERVRVRVLDLADNARDVEWYTSFRDVLTSDVTRDDLARYIGYENEASEIRSYEPELVPGLLQTPDYMAAIMERFHPDRTDAERARLVDFRVARQQVLTRKAGALRLRLVIGELVVRRITTSHAVMAEQLQHLIDHVRGAVKNVDLRIVPATLGIPAAVGGPFVVMSLPAGEPDLVYLESREGATYRQDGAVGDRYSEYFEDLLGAAFSPSDAVELIEEVLKQLELT